jgi:hypothetical protein
MTSVVAAKPPNATGAVAIPSAPAEGPRPPPAGASFASFLARPRPVAASTTVERTARPNGGATAHAASAGGSARKSTVPARALPTDPDGTDDPLDPLHRRRAALQPPQGFAPPPTVVAPLPPSPPVPGSEPLRARAAASLEHLLPALVRRVAWSGDGRRGTARLEIGAGDLAGAVLQIDADEGRVRVHLDVPAGVDARAWQERIERSLRDRNVATDALEVT